MGDYAQTNTLDYDNDEDAEMLNTQGIISIDNENIELENELVSLDFSASTNRFYNNPNSIHDKTTFAVVPCYDVKKDKDGNTTDVTYNEPSPRILALNITTSDGLAHFEYGYFPRTMYFGGYRGETVCRLPADPEKVPHDYGLRQTDRGRHLQSRLYAAGLPRCLRMLFRHLLRHDR